MMPVPQNQMLALVAQMSIIRMCVQALRTVLVTQSQRMVMVISTQRKTKKFDILTENTMVALLVHDFATHSDETNHNYSPVDSRPRYSITLNGRVRLELVLCTALEWRLQTMVHRILVSCGRLPPTQEYGWGDRHSAPSVVILNKRFGT